MPDEAEAHALLALILVNHACSTARFRNGDLVLLDDQDRALWNQDQIDEGREPLERALTLHGSGPYIIQAAIADLHIQQPRDWETIALLYQRLEHITSSPVVTINRAIAVAELEGTRSSSLPARPPRARRLPFTTTRPAPTCCDASVATMKHALPTHAPSS